MQNTYQDLITEVQSKNPQIHHKLEGGKKFEFASDFKPAGDQPDAIKKLVDGAKKKSIKSGFIGCYGFRKNFYDGKSNSGN
jgi:excinuclease ABC subunit B